MESTYERILHYQRNIDRSVVRKMGPDKERLLHCIKALSKLPVTMNHLQQTGIGRTVNSLRKIDSGVGEASKRLVTKWKDMISNEPGSGESDEACVPDDPDSYESLNEDQENNSHAEYSDPHDIIYHGAREIEKRVCGAALPLPLVIDVGLSPNEQAPNMNDMDDEPVETSCSQPLEPLPVKEESSKRDSTSFSSDKHSSDMKDSSKVSKSSKDYSKYEHKKKDKDKDKSRYESSSSKDRKHNSESKKRKAESSDEDSSQKRRKSSPCEDVSDNDVMSNNFVIDDEDGESSSNERDTVMKVSSKDRHKESSPKHSDQSKSTDKHHSSSSSSSSSSSKTKSHDSKKDKSSDERKEKDKHKSKSSSSSKETNGKDKERHNKDDKDKSRYEEKSKDKKKDKKSKEHKEKKKSKTETMDGSIDSMSGTSFADALGMCSMLPPKKKKDSSVKTSSKSEQPRAHSPQPIPIKLSPPKSKPQYIPSPTGSSSPDDSPALLAPNIELEPLGKLTTEVLASTLPEPSPYYKPLPPVNAVQRRVDEEAMLSQVINAKVQRTKVYSGNKATVYTTVPTFVEVCTRVLIDNIDAIECTGGIPYFILKPILLRATAQQLLNLEYYNPYLLEDTDELWQFHCNKEFRTKQRKEMETWREMYLRCLDEREAKFKQITANIKQSIDKSAPARSTKLAYVDHFVKPPRNVLRQQAKYGTAKVTTSASDLKKKLITGSAGPSASSSGGSSGNYGHSSSANAGVERISVPPPPQARARASSSHSVKKAKAPLMAKALQAIKGGRFKR